jgi:hypothetical protein
MTAGGRQICTACSPRGWPRLWPCTACEGRWRRNRLAAAPRPGRHKGGGERLAEPQAVANPHHRVVDLRNPSPQSQRRAHPRSWLLEDVRKHMGKQNHNRMSGASREGPSERTATATRRPWTSGSAQREQAECPRAARGRSVCRGRDDRCLASGHERKCGRRPAGAPEAAPHQRRPAAGSPDQRPTRWRVAPTSPRPRTRRELAPRRAEPRPPALRWAAGRAAHELWRPLQCVKVSQLDARRSRQRRPLCGG